MIALQDVGVRLGRKQILEGISLSAAPGKVTAIVGPNGSGKSTLMKAISAEVACTGAISINGISIHQMRPAQAAAMRAVLPQASTLSFPFTVREVVGLGLTGGNSGVSGPEQARLPERALERVDLAGFAGRFYQELSGGEQQRVQLARVLCQIWTPVLDGQPRWLLLDEPISSLDIRHQLLIMRLAAAFAAGGGGVVAILHDLNLTAMFADHVVLMDRGRVAAEGPPAEVLEDGMISDVFGCPLRVNQVPAGGGIFLLPQSAGL
jgi:iron complex transport system ATP-binding protein